MGIAKRLGLLAFAGVLFFFFFNGYQQAGPSKKKFKQLGGSDDVVDLTKEKQVVEVNRLKEVAGDKRLTAWAGWWR